MDDDDDAQNEAPPLVLPDIDVEALFALKRKAICDLLVAALIHCKEISDTEVSEHVLEALRTLLRDQPIDEEEN